MTTERINPYEPPKSDITPPSQSGVVAPPLWNPGAAASWSLMLSPAFGAFLHAKNWEALGDAGRARNQRRWAWVYIAAVLLSILQELFFVGPRTVGDSPVVRINFSSLFALYLVIWYVATARRQMQFVRDSLGTNYPRRGWLKPVGLALTIIVGMLGTVAIGEYLLAKIR